MNKYLQASLSLAVLAITTGCDSAIFKELLTAPSPSGGPTPSASPTPRNRNQPNNSAETPTPSFTPFLSQANDGAESGPISNLNFNTNQVSLALQEERPFDLLLRNQRGQAVTEGVIWTSSDTSVVTVSPTGGRVRGVGNGRAIITAAAASSPTIKAQLEVTVEEKQAVKNISIDPALPVVPLGDTVKLVASVFLADGQINADVTWSSSDNDVATVDAQTGVVTASQEGTVTILATYNGDTRFRGSAQVKVIKKAALPSILPSAPPAAGPALPGGTIAKPAPLLSASASAPASAPPSPSPSPTSTPTPSASPPSTPAGLNGTNITATSVKLTWNAVSNAGFYRIYQNGLLLKDNLQTTSLDLTDLLQDSVYRYQVTAVKDSTESSKSAFADITTPVTPDNQTVINSLASARSDTITRQAFEKRLEANAYGNYGEGQPKGADIVYNGQYGVWNFKSTAGASGFLKIRGAMDDSTSTAVYNLKVVLNGQTLFQGNAPFEHGTPNGGMFVNWKTLELPVSNLQEANTLYLTVSNGSSGNWVGVDWIDVP